MMKFLKAISLLSIISCTSFSNYSKFNEIVKCEDPSYICTLNQPLNLQYKSFGGFHFANNYAEYRKMKVMKKPKFKNIILYGRSNVLHGDYYLILENKKYPQNYFYRDTIIDNRKITIALNKTIDYKPNKDFLLNINLAK